MLWFEVVFWSLAVAVAMDVAVDVAVWLWLHVHAYVGARGVATASPVPTCTSYLAIKAYADKGEVLTDPEHKRFLERTMRDYRRAGMHLPSDKRKRVEELRRKVKGLETTYSQNLAEEKTTL